MMRAQAPGKIILFGEHAVVYNRPALAVPVFSVAAQVEADGGADEEANKRIQEQEDWRAGVIVDAPNVRLRERLSALESTHPLRVAVEETVRALQVSSLPPVRLTVTSTIPVASGLGSGAAVSVALIRCVAGVLGKTLSEEDVNTIAYSVEKLHHGTPSGIDNTVITYARPVFFVRGQPIETFTVGAPFTLVIGDTGVAAPTKESVGDVRALWQADAPRWEKVFDAVARIVTEARAHIENGQWRKLGVLMDENHALLQEMTVSSAALDALVLAARGAGALGAKLSGGGRGGNMIALTEEENAPAVAEALVSAGARGTIITRLG